MHVRREHGESTRGCREAADRVKIQSLRGEGIFGFGYFMNKEMLWAMFADFILNKKTY